MEFQKSTERQPGYYKDRLDKLDLLIDQKLKEKLNADLSIRDQPQHNLDSLESLDQGEQSQGRYSSKRVDEAKDRFQELVSSWNGRIKTKKEDPNLSSTQIQ